MQQPKRTTEFKIKDHTFEVSYPKSGQMIDIAVLKSKLSDNQYTNILTQYSGEAPLAVRLIDVYSFLTIMIPNFKENINSE